MTLKEPHPSRSHFAGPTIVPGAWRLFAFFQMHSIFFFSKLPLRYLQSIAILSLLLYETGNLVIFFNILTCHDSKSKRKPRTYLEEVPHSLQFTRDTFLFVTECQNEMAQKPQNSPTSLKYAQKEGNEIKKGPLKSYRKKVAQGKKLEKPHHTRMVISRFLAHLLTET